MTWKAVLATVQYYYYIRSIYLQGGKPVSRIADIRRIFTGYTGRALGLACCVIIWY